MFFGGSKKEPNIIFYGLGGIGLTKAMFLEDISGINATNITLYDDDGTDLNLYINSSFNLGAFGSNRSGFTTPTRLLINANCTGILDETGLINMLNGSNFYNSTVFTSLVVKGLTTITNESLRNISSLQVLDAPILESVSNNGLAYIGSVLNPIITSFPLLAGNFNSSNCHIKWQDYSPLVTGTMNLTMNQNTTINPFPNASELSTQCFRNCHNLEGDLDLPNVTGTVNFSLIINNARKITAFRIPNATKLTNSNASFNNCFLLEELDIRNVTEWVETATTDYAGINLPNLTIRANTALQTEGAGSTMHPAIQTAIDGGATLIWY